jgi:hypothetical protein
MQEPDTYFIILEDGKVKQVRQDGLSFAEEELAASEEAVKAQQEGITDRGRSGRRVRRRRAKPPTWEEDFLFMALRHVWQDSDTYQAILEEGELLGAREDVLIAGEELVGPADDSITAQVHAITDRDRLTRMLLRTLKAASWQEILETP